MKWSRRAWRLMLIAPYVSASGFYGSLALAMPPDVKGEKQAVAREPVRPPTYVAPAARLSADLKKHAERCLSLVDQHINPDTHIAYSFTGDARLAFWAVVYDNAIRAMVHLRTGDEKRARATLDYFINASAIRKSGWIRRDGALIVRPGWIVNIIDAAESRPGGRGIEHIAHVGPNAYLGIASAHLYAATKDPAYLAFARERWDLIHDLQNTDPASPNYGGVRMGPLGDPANEREQRVDFDPAMPSYYELYNGEHAADYLGFSLLMARVDPERGDAYRRDAELIKVWDRRIWDPKKNLFFIGTTEKRYFDNNIGVWVDPGVIPMRPLDTSALKISAYGVEAFDAVFGAGAIQRLRQAIDDNFKVSVRVAGPTGGTIQADGYDFVTHEDRARIVLFEEQGARGDRKVKVGVGREPMLSDEWSNWVSLADLRLAADFLELDDTARAAAYLQSYRENAVDNAKKTAIETSDGSIAYPYSHPLPYALNKPVGFGWNTHHQPYALIGSCARILGFLRFDPFLPNGGAFALNASLDIPEAPLVQSMPKRSQALYTEAELYLQEAWAEVRMAEKSRGQYEDRHWANALETVERMMTDHPDWADIARRQNQAADQSDEHFPLEGRSDLSIGDLEPVYRKYWALYHVGTAEFIRVMASARRRDIARARGDDAAATAFEEQARASARKITTDFSYAQAYDESGWLWQPAQSLREFADLSF